MPATAPPTRTPLTRLLALLKADIVLAALLAALPVLALLTPLPATRWAGLVDWPTIAALAGLLMLTQGIETSGALQRLGRWLVGLMRTERRAALLLVLAAALLSTVLTNDVALFVVVPLTLAVHRIAPLPVARLMVFEALAVNAGSALTPIGNPQNLFLWQLSGGSFTAFTAHMAPLVAGLMAALLVVTALAFRGRPVASPADAAPPPVNRLLLWVSLGLYGPFLLLTDHGQAGWAFVAVAAVFAVLRPALLRRIDWALLLVFVLMFVDLRLLAGLPAVHGWLAAQPLHDPRQLFVWGVLMSQVISNVPATIALAEFSRDWQTLAWAVNIGGFGLAIGSLANLIALRLARGHGAGRLFHLWSVPFLVVSALVVRALLFGGCGA